jgi:hypothetical protein
MQAVYTPDRVTPYTFEEARNLLGWALKHANFGNAPKLDVLAVALAKLMLESGRFRSIHCHNPGNIKCSETQGGMYTAFTCNELIVESGRTVVAWYSPFGRLDKKGGAVVKEPYDGEPWHYQTRFVANPTAARGFEHYVEFLQRPRYAEPYRALLSGNPEGFSRALSRAGYYTAPVEDYTRTLVALFNECRAKAQGIPYEEVPIQESYWDWQALCAEVRGDSWNQAQESVEIAMAEGKKDMREP